jgi:UDP-N-acetylmuramate--alanine ligase
MLSTLVRSVDAHDVASRRVLLKRGWNPRMAAPHVVLRRNSLAEPKLPPGRVPAAAHLVGVCGSGMKALAELLTGMGCRVSGSDMQLPTGTLAAMQRRGLRIHRGHSDRFLSPDVDVLIYSPAIPPANPERQQARRLQVPQMSYSEMLGRLMQNRTGVSIAGTHGKSTTTAMTASILTDSGLAPSVVVGAEVCGRGASGWAGEGSLFVVESCEYQRSFLNLSPRYAAILGIEPDHFDCYPTFEETTGAFRDFAARVDKDGVLLIRGDCTAAAAVAQAASCEVMTFSLDQTADWWAADLRTTALGTRFRVFHQGRFIGEVSLQVPGKHNVQNALAAAALCHSIGVSARDICDGLAEFRGVKRRYEYVGSWRGVTLIDDYAHHPTAVRATLETARRESGRRRIWCAFQPHQSSRTAALMDEFAASFSPADEVLIAPTFAAREAATDGPEPTAIELAERIGTTTHSRYCPSLDRIVATLEDETRPGDVLVTMGAGDIDRVQHEFTRRLQRHHPSR